MQRGPAPRLGHSVQHVIDTVRATRARRESGAVSADANAKNETKDREAGSPRGSPRSPRSPYAPRSPRRSTLLDQLLQQQVLGKSSRSPGSPESPGSAGWNGGYPMPDAPGTSLEAPLPTSSLSIPVLHRSGRGMTHLLGRPLEVVQEEFEAFSESVGSRSRPVTIHSTPRVADLPAKVKWETLLASREASRQTAGCPTKYLLKDRFKTCKISSSIMASRFSEPSDPGLSDLMVQECTWCRAALPATAASRSEGVVQCPSCHRSFDGRKAKMSMFGGEGLQ